MATTYAVIEQNPEVQHVVPVDDLFEHDCSNGDCTCGPEFVLEDEGTIWRHHSLDGREVELPSED